MKHVDARNTARKTSLVLLALVGLTLLPGCTTMDDDQGQSRDRPTGGTNRSTS